MIIKARGKIARCVAITTVFGGEWYVVRGGYTYGVITIMTGITAVECYRVAGVVDKRVGEISRVMAISAINTTGGGICMNGRICHTPGPSCNMVAIMAGYALYYFVINYVMVEITTEIKRCSVMACLTIVAGCRMGWCFANNANTRTIAVMAGYACSYGEVDGIVVKICRHKTERTMAPVAFAGRIDMVLVFTDGYYIIVTARTGS